MKLILNFVILNLFLLNPHIKKPKFQHYSISLIVLIFANKILILKYKSKKMYQKKVIFYSIIENFSKIEYFLKSSNKILNHLSFKFNITSNFYFIQIFLR